jgi:hypothetical protein
MNQDSYRVLNQQAGLQKSKLHSPSLLVIYHRMIVILDRYSTNFYENDTMK